MAELKFQIPDGLDLDVSAIEAQIQKAVQRAIRDAEREAYKAAIGKAVTALKASLEADGVDLSGKRLTIYFNGEAGPEWSLRNTTNGKRKGRARIKYLGGIPNCDIEPGTVFTSSEEMRAVLAEFDPRLEASSAKKWPTKAFQRLGVAYEWVN